MSLWLNQRTVERETYVRVSGGYAMAVRGGGFGRVYLETLLDGKVDGPVGDDDIAALRKRRNNGRDGGECLGVDDARLDAEEPCDFLLGIHVDVLSAVEIRGPAGANTIAAQDLHRAFLDELVRDQIVVVGRRQIGHRLAARQLHSRTGGSSHDGAALLLEDLEFGWRRHKRFRRPFFDQLVNLLSCVQGGD